MSRQQQSPGEELERARVGLNPRGLRSNPVPRPCVPAQVLLHCARRFCPLGELVGPLRSRCDAAGAGAAQAGLRRARRGFLRMASFLKAQTRSFSQPPGRKVTAGACAGGDLRPGGRPEYSAAAARRYETCRPDNPFARRAAAPDGHPTQRRRRANSSRPHSRRAADICARSGVR